MKRILIVPLILALLGLSIPCFAGMTIPSDIKKTICFIFVQKNGKEVPNGTGFFVSIQNPDNNKVYVYLVTAKHVLQSSPDKGIFHSSCFIRLNEKGGGTKQIPINIFPTGKKKNVFMHEDSTVDIAVIPLIPDFKIFDYKTIPMSYLTNRKDFQSLNVREGSDIFFAGMFTPHIGQQKNYPIFRFGRIALLSDEKILFMGKKRDLYLIEMLSFGGNSGSPVFIHLGADRKPGSLILGSPILKIAGVISGTYQKGYPVIKVPTSTDEQLSLDNMGIAAVTPCYHLREIILSEDLKKIRGF